jgi:hypothetical protein
MTYRLSSFVKERSGVDAMEVCPMNFASNSARLAYRLRALLDSPPPTNPPDMVLTAILTLSSPDFSPYSLCRFL